MAFGKLRIDEIETSTQTVSVDALIAITADGDKGDITVSGNGAVWSIDDGAVDTAALGGDITIAGKALLDDADAAAQRTTLGAEAAGTAASAISTHEAAADPHPGYALEGSLATVATTGAYSDLTGTPTIPVGADATPQPLGAAAIGISADYAREDHVHAMPSAADVGADPAGTASSAISTHEAAADPHPGYALESDLGGAALLDVGTTTGTVAAGDDSRFVPAGGTAGQALLKASGTDYDASWQDITTGIDDLTDVTITSVADGEVLTYDSATSQWINATPTTPGGSDTQIQYNSSGSFAGSADLTWDDTAKELGVGGNIAVPPGSQSAPSLIFTGDTNTGIYSPGADQLALSTNGTGRLFVDASGTTFVGTTTNTHSAKLVVGGTIAETVSGTQYPVFSSYDIGTSPDKVPINSYLGRLAFLDEVGRLIPAATAPTSNLDINFEYVSDTSLKIRMKGSDGVVRSATLTLS